MKEPTYPRIDLEMIKNVSREEINALTDHIRKIKQRDARAAQVYNQLAKQLLNYDQERLNPVMIILDLESYYGLVGNPRYDYIFNVPPRVGSPEPPMILGIPVYALRLHSPDPIFVLLHCTPIP